MNQTPFTLSWLAKEAQWVSVPMGPVAPKPPKLIAPAMPKPTAAVPPKLTAAPQPKLTAPVPPKLTSTPVKSPSPRLTTTPVTQPTAFPRYAPQPIDQAAHTLSQFAYGYKPQPDGTLKLPYTPPTHGRIPQVSNDAMFKVYDTLKSQGPEKLENMLNWTYGVRPDAFRPQLHAALEAAGYKPPSVLQNEASTPAGSVVNTAIQKRWPDDPRFSVVQPRVPKFGMSDNEVATPYIEASSVGTLPRVYTSATSATSSTRPPPQANRMQLGTVPWLPPTAKAAPDYTERLAMTRAGPGMTLAHELEHANQPHDSINFTDYDPPVNNGKPAYGLPYRQARRATYELPAIFSEAAHRIAALEEQLGGRGSLPADATIEIAPGRNVSMQSYVDNARSAGHLGGKRTATELLATPAGQAWLKQQLAKNTKAMPEEPEPAIPASVSSHQLPRDRELMYDEP